jgi:hypothetical protein
MYKYEVLAGFGKPGLARRERKQAFQCSIGHQNKELLKKLDEMEKKRP